MKTSGGVSARGKVGGVPGKVLVTVQARCGHDDYHYLEPGEWLHIQGQFSLCNRCSRAQDESTPVGAEA